MTRDESIRQICILEESKIAIHLFERLKSETINEIEISFEGSGETITFGLNDLTKEKIASHLRAEIHLGIDQLKEEFDELEKR